MRGRAKKRNKLIISIAILLVGGVSSIFGIKALNQTMNLQPYDLGKFTWTNNTNYDDVADAIYKNEALNSFKNQSLDFLKSQTYTYGLKINKLDKQKAASLAYGVCDKYERELNSFIENYSNPEFLEEQRKSLSSPLAKMYSEIVRLNKENNIEVIDYYQFKNTLLPEFESEIINNSENNTQKIEYLRKFGLLEKQAEDKILKKHLHGYYFNRFLNDSVEKEDEKTMKEKEYDFVGAEILKMIGNKALVVNQDFDFASLLAPYSEDGKNGYVVKEKENILSQEDVYQTFLAKRDFLGNTDLLEPEEDANANEETSDENEQPLLPLDKYVPDNEYLPSFEKNEIIPGYTLQAKIVEMDYETNSDTVKVGFQLGTSKTNDINNEIVWFSPSNPETQNDGYLMQEFSIHSFAQKLNCANNFFYPNDLKLEYKNKQFDISKITSRITISELLKNAPVDENDYYEFDEQHPFLVNISDEKIPGVVAPHQLENNHLNQRIMLAITKANTNFDEQQNTEQIISREEFKNSQEPYRLQNLIPYVEAKWVIADTVPEKPEEYRIVKEFKWDNEENHQEIDSLPFYFPYSNKELALLQDANITTKIIHNFFVLAYDKEGKKINVAKDIYESMKLSSNIDVELNSLLLAFTGISDVMMCMSAVGIVGMGIAGVDTVLDAALVAEGVKSSVAKKDILPTVKEISNLVEKFKKTIPYETAKTYAEYYNKLHDASVAVSAKLDIATISKDYLWVFGEKIFEFFTYVIEMNKDKNFVDEAKFWMDSFKKDVLGVRKLLVSYGSKVGLGKMDEKIAKEYLNYKNPKAVEGISILNAEDVDTLDNINFEMWYSYNIHYQYFSTVCVWVGSLLATTKFISTIASQVVLMRNINKKDKYAQQVVEEFEKGVELEKIPLATPGLKTALTTEEGRQMLDNEIGAIIKNSIDIGKRNQEKIKAWKTDNPGKYDYVLEAQDYMMDEKRFKKISVENTLNEVDEAVDVNQVNVIESASEKTVTSEKEYKKFLNRKSLNPLFGRVQLVFCAITILVGVAETITEKLLSDIPKEDAEILKQMAL